MTPDEIAAKFAEIAARLAAVEAKAARVDDLQAQINALNKRLDAHGDYAGETRFRHEQLRISTEARLRRLETDDNEAQS